MVAVNKYAAAALAAAGKQEQTQNEFWVNVVILTESQEYPYASIGGFPLTDEVKSKGQDSSNEEFAATVAAGIGARLEVFEFAQTLEPGESAYFLPSDSPWNIQVNRRKTRKDVSELPRPKLTFFK